MSCRHGQDHHLDCLECRSQSALTAYSKDPVSNLWAALRDVPNHPHFATRGGIYRVVRGKAVRLTPPVLNDSAICAVLNCGKRVVSELYGAREYLEQLRKKLETTRAELVRIAGEKGITVAVARYEAQVRAESQTFREEVLKELREYRAWTDSKKEELADLSRVQDELTRLSAENTRLRSMLGDQAYAAFEKTYKETDPKVPVIHVVEGRGAALAMVMGMEPKEQ